MRPTFVIALTALLLAAPAAAHNPKPTKHTKVTHSGKLVARTASSVTVKTGKHTVTCARTDSSPNVKHAKVGHKVKISCKRGVLVSFAHVLSGNAAGTITALSASSLTVHAVDFDLTCTLGDASPKLGDYHVGDKVKLACTNGVLTAIGKVQTTMITTGTLVDLTPTSLRVLCDGGNKTCTRNATSPSLDGYATGDHVKATCVNGVLTAIAHL